VSGNYSALKKWNCMVSMNVLIGLKLMIFFKESRAD